MRASTERMILATESMIFGPRKAACTGAAKVRVVVRHPQGKRIIHSIAEKGCSRKLKKSQSEGKKI